MASLSSWAACVSYRFAGITMRSCVWICPCARVCLRKLKPSRHCRSLEGVTDGRQSASAPLGNPSRTYVGFVKIPSDSTSGRTFSQIFSQIFQIGEDAQGAAMRGAADVGAGLWFATEEVWVNVGTDIVKPLSVYNLGLVVSVLVPLVMLIVLRTYFQLFSTVYTLWALRSSARSLRPLCARIPSIPK